MMLEAIAVLAGVAAVLSLLLIYGERRVATDREEPVDRGTVPQVDLGRFDLGVGVGVANPLEATLRRVDGDHSPSLGEAALDHRRPQITAGSGDHDLAGCLVHG